MSRSILQGYGAYNFRDKDPVIDGLRTALEDRLGHRLTMKDLRQIERSGGPTAAAMAGWFFGETISPFNKGVEAAGRSQGMERRWVSSSAVKPTEKQLTRWKGRFGKKKRKK